MDGFTAVKTRHHYVMSGGQVSKGETVLGCRETSEVHLVTKKPNLYLDNLQCVGLSGPTHAYNCFFFFSPGAGPGSL